MIARYSRPAMASLWSAESSYALWLQIETLALEGLAAIGAAPPEAAAALRAHGRVDVARVEILEATTRHEVVAFITHLAEQLGPHARYLHQGMTSSDVLDTALALQLRSAADLLLDGLDSLMDVLRRRSLQHRHDICLARTHGIAAEPTTFGLKLAGHFAEFQRARLRLERAREEIGFCKLSGAVGNYATIDPRVEGFVAERLGLAVEPAPTQAIPRDRHAAYLGSLGLAASAVERLAVEIRHLQRSEVAEAAEPFGEGQKGSSAMPHKRNPLLCENLTGLARVIRSNVAPGMENIVLWHERDISHSSVERLILPESTILLDFALHRLTQVVEDLEVDPDAMLANLKRAGGEIYSQSAMLALVDAGHEREWAYQRVQRHARAAREGAGLFIDLLLADPDIADSLARDALRRLPDPKEHVRHVDTIIERVFNAA